MLTMVIAISDDGAIGDKGGMPWARIPEDMRHFRKVTTGHAVIMGRKTYESIGKPLPDRKNIVVSRTLVPTEGIEVTKDPLLAFGIAVNGGDESPCLNGGAQLYSSALFVFVKRIWLTEVHATFPDADTRWTLDRAGWAEKERRDVGITSYVLLERG